MAKNRSLPLLFTRVRRFRGADAGSTPAGSSRLARPVAVVASCALVGALYPFAVHAFTSQQALAGSGGDPRARAALVLVGLGIVSSVFVGAFAVDAWGRRRWGLAGRLHYSVVAVAALVASGLWWVVLGLA